MRRILVLVFVLLSIQGFAQPSNYSWYKQRTRQYSFMADSAMYLPRYNGTPSGVRSAESSTISGMVGIDTTNHRQYFRSGGNWIRLAKYTELGVDSIWRVAGKDTIFYSKFGTTYAIKDSAGGGSTPTLQQVLTSGSTLTTNNTISGGGTNWSWTNMAFYSYSGTRVYHQLSTDNAILRTGTGQSIANLAMSSGASGSLILTANRQTAGLSDVSILGDSIILNPYSGQLNIPSLRVGSSTDSVMVWDASTGVVGYRDAASFGGSYTASNGLTLSGSNFKLGGTLGENTTITQDGFTLGITDLLNFADTTNWKPVVVNTTGSGATAGTLRKATYWPVGSGSGITVGTTTITSGTSGRVAYNNAGVYGEKAVTGTGDVVLATSPSITTPVIVTSYTLNDGATKATFATNFYGMDISSKSVRFTSSGNTYLKVTTNDESATDPAVTVNTIVTGKPGIKILLTGSQTADAFYVENSGGNKLVDITANGVLDLYNYGTAPTASVTNGIRLYAEDVSSSAELKVRDEAGNITTLSPHNFSKIPGGKSEEMAWSFYSEKDGQYINVDMLKLARLVEKLTGEKLVYTGKK